MLYMVKVCWYPYDSSVYTNDDILRDVTYTWESHNTSKFYIWDTEK